MTELNSEQPTVCPSQKPGHCPGLFPSSTPTTSPLPHPASSSSCGGRLSFSSDHILLMTLCSCFSSQLEDSHPPRSLPFPPQEKKTTKTRIWPGTFCICMQCHPRLSKYLVYLPVHGELLSMQCWAQGWDSVINF